MVFSFATSHQKQSTLLHHCRVYKCCTSAFVAVSLRQWPASLHQYSIQYCWVTKCTLSGVQHCYKVHTKWPSALLHHIATVCIATVLLWWFHCGSDQHCYTNTVLSITKLQSARKVSGIQHHCITLPHLVLLWWVLFRDQHRHTNTVLSITELQSAH